MRNTQQEKNDFKYYFHWGQNDKNILSATIFDWTTSFNGFWLMIFSIQLYHFLSLFWKTCHNCICLAKKNQNKIFYIKIPTGTVEQAHNGREEQSNSGAVEQQNSGTKEQWNKGASLTLSYWTWSYTILYQCHYLAFSIVGYKMRCTPKWNLPYWPGSIIT